MPRVLAWIAVVVASYLMVAFWSNVMVPTLGGQVHAALEADERLSLADCIAGVAEAGGVAALVITKDDDFAKRAAHRALRLEAATGALKPIKRGWFS